MGIITTTREALSAGAIRQALKSPARVQVPPSAALASSTPAASAPAVTDGSSKRARIGKKGPPIFEGIPAPHSATTLVTYEALDANPQAWFRIMESADRGHTGPMIDMFCDARDRDIHLDGVARKRAMSMMGRPLAFRPADGLESDKEALDIAKRVRRALVFESQCFRSRLSHLMQGPVDGYAVCPLLWSVNSDGVFVPHLQWVHTNRIAFRRTDFAIGYYTGAYRSATNVRAFSEDAPDLYVVHAPAAGRSDYTWRSGAMRSAIIPSFIKRNGLKFWMTLAERFGMPQPFATIPDGEDDDEEATNGLVAKTKLALQNLGRLWSMVVSEGVKIESIPGAGQVNADVHKELIQWANTAQSIGMLGQNLTTEVSGGSFAAAEAHRFVAGDLHLADATELAETITQQVIEPLVRYNWPGAPVPVLEISTAPKQVVQVEDVREGIFSPDERRRSMGYEAQSDDQGSDYRPPVKAQVPVQLDAP